MRSLLSRYRPEVLVGLALGVGTVLVFQHACRNEFLNYDDDLCVTANPHVLGGLTWDNVAWAFTTLHFSNWHPLTWLSFQLDAQLFGSAPAGYHATNVVLHAANTVLLFLALRSLTGAVGRSAVVAGLFSLHPLHVEPVAWVAERKGVLSTLFWMLTLLAYAAYARRGGRGRYVLVFLCLVLGLMAKAMLVTLPFVFLLLDYWPLGRADETGTVPLKEGDSPRFVRTPLGRLPGGPGREGVAPTATPAALVREKVPFVVVIVAFCGITLVAQHNSIQPLEQVPASVRLVNVPVNSVHYLVQTAWPMHLTGYYPLATHARSAPEAAGAVLLLTAVSVLAWRSRHRRPYVLVGWLWYLGTLVPVSGLVPLGTHVLADRYTYVPLVGIFWLLTWAGADLARATRAPGWAAPAVAGLLLTVCALLSWVQVTTWHDSRAFWEHYHDVEEPTPRTLSSLGSALREQGRLGEAEHCFREALRLDPASAFAASNLGALLSEGGRSEEALPLLTRAAERDPQNPKAQLNLGLALVRLGRVSESVPFFEAAARLDPDNAGVRNALGTALAEQGRWEEAVPHLEAALRLDPRLPTAHFLLGQDALRRGRPEEAGAHARAALELSPQFAQARRLLESVRDQTAPPGPAPAPR